MDQVNILGEQCDEGVDVSPLERIGVRADDGADFRVADLRRVCCWLTAGPHLAMILRALASAEFTEVVDVPIIAAISAAEKPSTSNSSGAARWLPGRCCSAATNPSSTASRSPWRG
jgi:hypothetical protein